MALMGSLSSVDTLSGRQRAPSLVHPMMSFGSVPTLVSSSLCPGFAISGSLQLLERHDGPGRLPDLPAHVRVRARRRHQALEPPRVAAPEGVLRLAGHLGVAVALSGLRHGHLPPSLNGLMVMGDFACAAPEREICSASASAPAYEQAPLTCGMPCTVQYPSSCGFSGTLAPISRARVRGVRPG